MPGADDEQRARRAAEGLSWSWELDFDAMLAALTGPAPWSRPAHRDPAPAASLLDDTAPSSADADATQADPANADLALADPVLADPVLADPAPADPALADPARRPACRPRQPTPPQPTPP